MRAIIVAYAGKNRVIGNRGDIPWMGQLPVDMRRVRELTTGNAIIMGLKTFESLGRALPNRQNIVLVKENPTIPGVEIAHNLDEAFGLVKDGRTAFIFGGGSVFRQVLDQNLVDKIYATEIQSDFDGDTFFPKIDPKTWREISRVHIPKDENNKFDADFVEYERR